MITANVSDIKTPEPFLITRGIVPNFLKKRPVLAFDRFFNKQSI